MATPLSILDLAPIVEGSDAAQAFKNSLILAKLADRLGYTRYWLAEHHNIPGVASAATPVVIGHIAGGTSRIRVGAGGIMLPNHAPLVIAEQFGTLASLYPGRIDLAVGRAPGGDQPTAMALRRYFSGSENFPQEVVELMNYFRPAQPDQAVTAVPGAGLDVPIWILGSSTYGAQLAAALGLPYGFASHFAPAEMMAAIKIYRESFKPSGHIEKPYIVLGLNVFAAPTDAEAKLLFSSLQQAFLNLRMGRPGKLPPPVEDFEETLPLAAKAMLRQTLSCAVVGSPDTVKRGLTDFIARTAADEIIVTANIFDSAARLRSFEILADVHPLRTAAHTPLA